MRYWRQDRPGFSWGISLFGAERPATEGVFQCPPSISISRNPLVSEIWEVSGDARVTVESVH